MEMKTGTEDAGKPIPDGNGAGSVRSVVLSREVEVLLEAEGVEPERIRCPRDLSSVTGAITGWIGRHGGPDSVPDGARVTVRSFEDPDKSDPLPEGGERWSGPYLVGGLEIEGDSVPGALSKLASATLSPEACMRAVERLSEELFLRSGMDGIVAVCCFGGRPAVSPLLNSMRPLDPKSVAALYQALSVQPRALRAWIGSAFPDMDVDWGDGPAQPGRPGLVLPPGY